MSRELRDRCWKIIDDECRAVDAAAFSDELKWKIKHDIVAGRMHELERALRAIVSMRVADSAPDAEKTQAAVDIAEAALLENRDPRPWAIVATESFYQGQGVSRKKGEAFDRYRTWWEARLHYDEIGFAEGRDAGMWEIRKLVGKS